MELERIVAGLVEKVERRYYGKYRGFVVDNEDKANLGRLRLKVPSVLGNDVVTGWALPCVPYGGAADQGFLFIPEQKSGVWVEFEEGDLEFPIWVGTFWSKPDDESELPKPNNEDGSKEDNVQDPPSRKIIKTMKGHTIQFEDKDGDEMIRIVAIMDDNHKHVITMNKDGIKVHDGVNGHELVLEKTGITFTDGVNKNNKIVMEQAGVTVQDMNGNEITLDANSGYPTGPGIGLNGGARICLEGLVDWLLTHQHVGNLGAPTPLFPADLLALQLKKLLPGQGVLTDRVKAK
jgi:hypothetical protein